MWTTKGCPRCGGDLYQERYLGAREVRCLQCGHELNQAELAALASRVKRMALAARTGSSVVLKAA